MFQPIDLNFTALYNGKAKTSAYLGMIFTKYDVTKLTDFAANVMNKAGLTEDEAALFAEALLHADSRGIGSHGISRLGVYSKRIAAGVIHSGIELGVLSEGESVYHFDAKAGPGVCMGRQMMDKCIEKAKKTGCCFATAKNGTHWGALSFYTKYAAEKGMIAIVSCNAEAGVAPFGGFKPMLGTNPLSIALPAKNHKPVCLDMATSMAARGKIVLAQKEGKSIPETWALGPDGKPTTDPNVALDQKCLLPFGAYKGYGIGLIIDMFCHALAGGGDSRHTNSFWHDFEHPQNLGYNMMVIDIEKFLPISVFGERIDRMIEEFKAVPTVPGVESVLIPGEIEDKKQEISEKEGVELSDKLVAELKSVGGLYDVDFPF